jgi:hypothetical protein
MKRVGLGGWDLDFLYTHDPILRVEDQFELGYELEEKQKQIIRSTAPRVILNCTRQYGKSTTASLVAAICAQSMKGLILITAPVERQAVECFRKVAEFLRKSMPGIRWPEENKTSIELPNGSRIVAVPTSGAIRSYTNPKLIIVDEAAFVADDDYKGKIRPMLSHGCRLIVLSSSFGRRGWYYDAWSDGNGWERIQVKASECTHISRDFLEEEKHVLGPWWYSQEYECEFLDNITSFFDMNAVMASLEDGIDPLFAIRQDPTLSFRGDDEVEPLLMGYESIIA